MTDALALPRYFADRVQHWLAVNERRRWDVRHGLFPLGMVQRWIERAEAAEARVVLLEAQLCAVKQLADHWERRAGSGIGSSHAGQLRQTLAAAAVSVADSGAEVRAGGEGALLDTSRADWRDHDPDRLRRSVADSGPAPEGFAGRPYREQPFAGLPESKQARTRGPEEKKP